MHITSATLMLKCETPYDTAVICDGTFNLTTSIDSFFSDTYVLVYKTMEFNGNIYFELQNDEDDARISEELYTMLSQTVFASEIREIAPDAIGTVEGFELKFTS